MKAEGIVSTCERSPIPRSLTGSLASQCWKDWPCSPRTGTSSTHSVPLPSSSLGMCLAGGLLQHAPEEVVQQGGGGQHLGRVLQGECVVELLCYRVGHHDMD